MNVLHAISPEADVDLAVAETGRDLQVIRRDECPGMIWQRPLDARLLEWIDALDPEQLPRTRQILQLAEVQSAVLAACSAVETPDTGERSLLVQDIEQLATAFNTVAPAPYLRLRLSVVTTNSCRKFHTDHVVARLICTYRGTGTQYGISDDGSDPDDIHTVARGTPVILRGGLWPTTPPAGLKHRSPPIEGTGETRLVLVLDPIFDPDEED